MIRVEVGEQKTDCDRINARLVQFKRGLPDLVFIQRRQHFAVGRSQPFGGGLAKAPPDQRSCLPGYVLHYRIVLRTLVAADMDNIPETGRCDHAGPHALVLQYRICRDRRAVEHMRNIRVGDAVAFAYLGNAPDYGYGGVIRGTGDLVDCDFGRGRVGQDNIGKCAADIYANDFHACGFSS